MSSSNAGRLNVGLALLGVLLEVGLRVGKVGDRVVGGSEGELLGAVVEGLLVVGDTVGDMVLSVGAVVVSVGPSVTVVGAAVGFVGETVLVVGVFVFPVGVSVADVGARVREVGVKDGDVEGESEGPSVNVVGDELGVDESLRTEGDVEGETVIVVGTWVGEAVGLFVDVVGAFVVVDGDVVSPVGPAVEFVGA